MAEYTKGYKVIGTMACGCKVIKHPDKTINPFIDYCPKHKAAPAMYEKLQRISRWLDMLIRQAEDQLSTCRFESLNEAIKKDLENYKGAKADIAKALALAEGKEG